MTDLEPDQKTDSFSEQVGVPLQAKKTWILMNVVGVVEDKDHVAQLAVVPEAGTVTRLLLMKQLQRLTSLLVLESPLGSENIHLPNLRS